MKDGIDAKLKGSLPVEQFAVSLENKVGLEALRMQKSRLLGCGNEPIKVPRICSGSFTKSLGAASVYEYGGHKGCGASGKSYQSTNQPAYLQPKTKETLSSWS